MEKELVWVDKNLVGKLDILQDICRIKETDINNLIERMKDDDEIFIQNIDDSLIELKCHAKRIREEYKKCVDEQIEKADKLWELCNNRIDESIPKIEKVKNLVSNLENKINELNNKIENIPLYRIANAIDTLERYENLSQEDKDRIELLIKNDKGDK